VCHREQLHHQDYKESCAHGILAPWRSGALLADEEGIAWDGGVIRSRFMPDSSEHFTGLGHGYYARTAHLDLSGDSIGRNYGSSHGQQAPLIVPFFLSSKGYGLFLNSTFPNSFIFNRNGKYEFALTGEGRMDYFVIFGPGFPDILDRYTQLTGRPRLPPRAMLGLALSDKGHDHTSATPSDELWWKKKVLEHRAAGFPIDHLVNDNRWRACGGTRCESCLEWDRTRFPDPAEYQRWVRENGLVVTIDFNRCIAMRSEGWLPSYNIPEHDSIDFGDSAPDFTRKEVRAWFWNLFWRKSLDPGLGFPGDALWIDEFDEMGKAPGSMVLGNGRTWAEMKNEWFLLIAKALVQEGWDRMLAPAKRPFVWVRGMTAGGQRYATLWSGDITPTYDDMKAQVRSLQLAGLAGFPYWGHDAGGFHDWETKKGPDEAMYRQWSMAFGSFSPFWKPHGMGQSRWPLDRSPESRRDAMRYCDLRYRLIPYIYTYAHEAHAHGLPIARAMVIDYPAEAKAWTHDLQYMWGREMLVAPDCSQGSEVSVWLPPGLWYDYWDGSSYSGGAEILVPPRDGKIPLFIRAGAVIPMANPAAGTALQRRDSLTIHVYAGADGSFDLYEDDGISEAYRTGGMSRTTRIAFDQRTTTVRIQEARGTFNGAPAARAYRVVLHGLAAPLNMSINGKALKNIAGRPGLGITGDGVAWDPSLRVLSIALPMLPVNEPLTLRAVQ
jgi:alpha-D-xyloside xylohydrolase